MLDVSAIAESDTMFDDFLARVEARSLRVAVVGIGVVGLPLAVAFAEAGFTTVGVDLDADRCAALARGVSRVTDVPSERLAPLVDSGRFTAVPVGVALEPVDAVFLCVPTPFSGGPDLTALRAAATAVGGILRAGMLVVVQSTSFPGTTTEVVRPLLEAGGLRAGVDFSLAFAPERVDPGNPVWNLHNTPKVVGGLTDDCARRAGALIGAGLGDGVLIHRVDSPAIAEMTKLLENAYRMVNIALVNEMAVLAHAMDIDFEQVLAAAATKPFGFAGFRPGVGPGGECIPVDPLYLAWKAREIDCDLRLVEVADQVNRGMARYVVQRVVELLGTTGRALRDRRVLCLGAAYKGGVADLRNSRAIRVMELLVEAGVQIEYVDPLVGSITVGGREYRSRPDGATASGFDLVVVLVASPTWADDPALGAGTPIFDVAGVLASVAGIGVEHL